MSFASALNVLRPTLPSWLWAGERAGKRVAVWGGSS